MRSKGQSKTQRGCVLGEGREGVEDSYFIYHLLKKIFPPAQDIVPYSRNERYRKGGKLSVNRVKTGKAASNRMLIVRALLPYILVLVK